MKRDIDAVDINHCEDIEKLRAMAMRLFDELGDARHDLAQFAAAVEAREAKLREPAADLQAACVDIVTFLPPFYEGGSAHDAAKRNLLNAMDRMSSALGGDGPAYVPKAQLDEANETIAKMRAAFEALNPEAYANGELIAEWLRVNRLVAPKKPTPCGVHPYATGAEIKTIGLFVRDGQTNREAYAEWSRRRGVRCECGADARERNDGGFHPQAIRDAVCPHCNNMPYDGATFRCPECGIDRHGVGHGAG